MQQSPPLYIITGTPGAGKTSVARHLMKQFPVGLHIPVDDLRGWVNFHEMPVWSEEMGRQFQMARQAAALMARFYLDAGHAAAIDDVIFPEDLHSAFLDKLNGHPVQPVLLLPDLDTTLQRNASRANKDFETSHLAGAIERIHQAFESYDLRGTNWIVIDSTHLTVEKTVEIILERLRVAL